MSEVQLIKDYDKVDYSSAREFTMFGPAAPVQHIETKPRLGWNKDMGRIEEQHKLHPDTWFEAYAYGFYKNRQVAKNIKFKGLQYTWDVSDVVFKYETHEEWLKASAAAAKKVPPSYPKWLSHPTQPSGRIFSWLDAFDSAWMRVKLVNKTSTSSRSNIGCFQSFPYEVAKFEYNHEVAPEHMRLYFPKNWQSRAEVPDKLIKDWIRLCKEYNLVAPEVTMADILDRGNFKMKIQHIPLEWFYFQFVNARYLCDRPKLPYLITYFHNEVGIDIHIAYALAHIFASGFTGGRGGMNNSSNVSINGKSYIFIKNSKPTAEGVLRKAYALYYFLNNYDALEKELQKSVKHITPRWGEKTAWVPVDYAPFWEIDEGWYWALYQMQNLALDRVPTKFITQLENIKDLSDQFEFLKTHKVQL